MLGRRERFVNPCMLIEKSLFFFNHVFLVLVYVVVLDFETNKKVLKPFGLKFGALSAVTNHINCKDRFGILFTRIK
jgi:hypothetical protein